MAPNKAPGIDKTPVRVIRDCLQAISYPLTSIINTSLLTACFPNVWKIAEVKPIPKEGDHEIASNNRPIYHFSLFYQKYAREWLTISLWNT